MNKKPLLVKYPLKSLCVDPFTIQFICLLFVVYFFTVQQVINAQWIQQIDGNSSQPNLLDITFINRSTGWVCGDGGVIIKTTNGGTNWIAQNSGVTNKSLYGIHAVDSNYVYCVGWFETILKTTDGGTDWIIIRNGPWGQGASFFGLYFLNRNTGWMLKNGYVIRTTDGCSSFDSTQLNFSYIRDVYFKDPLNGVLCTDGAGILKSTDSGVVWSQITIPHYNNGYPDFFKESFINNTGWIIGRACDNGLGNLVFKTSNFGTSWDTIGRVPYPYPQENYCVYFSSINTGWCGGTYGHIFKTTNGGFNWIEQVVPTQWFRRSMWFYNDSIGWAAGGFGEILFTSTSGQYVGIESNGNKVPAQFKLYQNYPNPFNNETVIEFDIPENGNYSLVIYDILGREVEQILNGYKVPGKYKITYNVTTLSSGVYVYKLNSTKYNEVKKFVLIK